MKDSGADGSGRSGRHTGSPSRAQRAWTGTGSGPSPSQGSGTSPPRCATAGPLRFHGVHLKWYTHRITNKRGCSLPLRARRRCVSLNTPAEPRREQALPRSGSVSPGCPPGLVLYWTPEVAGSADRTIASSQVARAFHPHPKCPPRVSGLALPPLHLSRIQSAKQWTPFLASSLRLGCRNVLRTWCSFSRG